MASNWAQVENGQIVESASQASLKKATAAEKNGMDKDAFLQLLVAQMRYQDPLEPTSNTEYISQYAQFSQVEQMQNMAATSELARATSLVGKEVYIKTTDSTGNIKYVRGNVDYVMIENGKAYLSINEQLYSLDELDTVADSKYLAAYDKALDFSIKMNKLPGINAVDMTYADQIDELEEIYNNMNDYEKSFIAQDTVKKLNEYIEKLKEVRARAEAAEKDKDKDKAEGTEDGGDSIDGVGDVEDTVDPGVTEGEEDSAESEGSEEAEGSKGTEQTE